MKRNGRSRTAIRVQFIAAMSGALTCVGALQAEKIVDGDSKAVAESHAASHAKTQSAFPAPWDARVEKATGQALDFLRSTQRADGGWQGVREGSHPAITAMVAQCFAQDPRFGPKHEIVRRAVRFVLAYQQDDGGIYDPQLGYANYTTSVAVMMLAALEDPNLAEPIRKAQGYLTGNQWVEGKTDPDGVAIDSGHPFYGGAGYGKHKRPDLSNTQMMVEALHASGLPKDDPAYRKALRFISRCQMQSQSNDMSFARGVEDGGFIYSPANGGESKAGMTEREHDSHLRSYGSMTYAGFKSLLYADLKRDDPRVKAAWAWIGKHYTLKANPNMPDRQSLEGLYYYYHVFARSLQAWGEEHVVDAEGHRNPWRTDLAKELLDRQHSDGSWVNMADRWYEGNPNLVTAYSVLALQAAGKDDPVVSTGKAELN